ncbi:MAG: hypothetical protein DSZ28_08425, partial [Thiothrix sp.]
MSASKSKGKSNGKSKPEYLKEKKIKNNVYETEVSGINYKERIIFHKKIIKKQKVLDKVLCKKRYFQHRVPIMLFRPFLGPL